MTDAGTRQRTAIARLLGDLRRLPQSGDIIVFGSVGRGAADPGDVDILLTDDAQAGYALMLARRHYPLLDVFIERDGILFVRNADASSWQRSRCAKPMRESIRRGGVSLRLIPRSQKQEIRP